MIARWFERDLPKALSLAFNGASVGGVVFAPLWVALISQIGFPMAALAVGIAMTGTIGLLSARFLCDGPAEWDLHLTGGRVPPSRRNRRLARLSRAELLRDRRFATISAAFALGLFAQIGLFAHLIARLTPELGTGGAAFAVSLTTICAVAGRSLLSCCIGERDRRIAAAANFSLQAFGVLLLSFGTSVPVLILGCVLFGLGVGNLIFLPPLIAQNEFDTGDVGTVVALVTAINQAVFALGPAVFGVLRDATGTYLVPFMLAAVAQGCAATIVMIGRR
jgi:predicted MFS family arabinose efflux permease